MIIGLVVVLPKQSLQLAVVVVAQETLGINQDYLVGLEEEELLVPLLLVELEQPMKVMMVAMVYGGQLLPLVAVVAVQLGLVVTKMALVVAVMVELVLLKALQHFMTGL